MIAEPFPCVLRLKFWLFDWQARRMYRRYADTQTGLVRFGRLAGRMLDTVLPMFSLSDSPTNQRAVFILPEQAGWQVALHVLPLGENIPPHYHPDMLSALLVLDGALQVKQDKDLHRSILHKGDVSVGLPHLSNMHAIRAISPVTVFLSLRRRVPAPKHYRKLACSALCSLGIGMATGVDACEKKPEMTMQQAHVLRSQARNVEQYQVPAGIYRVMAEQGNPEAQYWLGIMYLHGYGVPMDRATATEWVRLSAWQGYVPAEQMYSDLLNGLYDEMTGC